MAKRKKKEKVPSGQEKADALGRILCKDVIEAATEFLLATEELMGRIPVEVVTQKRYNEASGRLRKALRIPTGNVSS